MLASRLLSACSFASTSGCVPSSARRGRREVPGCSLAFEKSLSRTVDGQPSFGRWDHLEITFLEQAVDELLHPGRGLRPEETVDGRTVLFAVAARRCQRSLISSQVVDQSALSHGTPKRALKIA